MADALIIAAIIFIQSLVVLFCLAFGVIPIVETLGGPTLPLLPLFLTVLVAQGITGASKMSFDRD